MKKTLNEYIKYTQPVFELARIDNLGDFKSSNIGIYVKGGEGYQTEHGEPHFTICLDKQKNKCIRVVIPNSIDWISNKKLKILDNNDLDKQLKNELIKWLDDKNSDNNKMTNLESIIFTWNVLNKTNKNVKQAK